MHLQFYAAAGDVTSHEGLRAALSARGVEVAVVRLGERIDLAVVA